MQNQANQDSADTIEQTIRYQLEEGRKARAQGDTVRAKRAFRLATKLAPNNEVTWQEMATVTMGQERDFCLQQVERARTTWVEAPRPAPEKTGLMARVSKNKRNIAVLAVISGLIGLLLLTVLIYGGWLLFQNNTIDPSMSHLYQAGESIGPKTFKAKDGGRLDLGGAAFYVPPDSLINDTAFSIDVLSSNALSVTTPAALIPIGLPVRVSAENPAIRIPVWVGLRYDRSRLPRGIAESSLQLAYLENDQLKFLDSSVDTENQVVRARLSHFSAPVIQIFAIGIQSQNELSTALQKNLQSMDAGDYAGAEKSLAEIVSAYQDRISSLNAKEISDFYLAWYRQGECVYIQGRYLEAGNIFDNLVESALKNAPEQVSETGSGVSLALSALASKYPLGIKLTRALKDNRVLARIPDYALTSLSESNLVWLSDPLAFDSLPEPLKNFFKEYEKVYGNEEAIVTDSRVDVLVLSSQVLSSRTNFEDAYTQTIRQILANNLIDNETVDRASTLFQDRLKNITDQNLQSGLTSNTYLAGLPLEGDPVQKAPLILLRVERQWQGDKKYYAQYLLALAPDDLQDLRKVPGDAIPDISMIFDGKNLTQSQVNHAWYVLGDFVTDDTENSRPSTGLLQSHLLDSGNSHTCIINGGTVQCWGSNQYGQLGSSPKNFSKRSFPFTIDPFNGNFQFISAGGNHTCVLNDRGAVLCWGRNDAGQLGDGTADQRNVPTQVSGLTEGIVSLTAGQNHTCGLHENGLIWCWGSNANGQLGIGTGTEKSLVPVRVENLTDVKAIAAGANHTCALTASGSVFCWGGATGSGSEEGQRLPKMVTQLEKVDAITAGLSHSCALSDGRVYCWGDNANGQLGDGTIQNRAEPVLVKGIKAQVIDITAGDRHSCALLKDGTVVCWGDNSRQELGIKGDMAFSSSPTTVNGLNNPVELVSAGGSHTCALMNNGEVSCWGDNILGQLGGDSLDKTGICMVIGYGGHGQNDPTGNLSVEPAAEGKIEMGSTITLRVTDLKAYGLQNTIKEVVFLVSSGQGQWEKIQSMAPENAEAVIQWNSAGKALNSSLVFKIEIIDQLKNQTVRNSREYSMVDTLQPVQAKISVVSQKTGQSPEQNFSKIEMGDWVRINATEVMDNLNGSGIKQVSFKVIENGVANEIITTRAEPYTAYWPVPRETQKRLNDRVQFVVDVYDQAGNVASFSTGSYTLVDTQPPSAEDSFAVSGTNCHNGTTPNCFEFGSSISITLSKVTDNFLGSGVDHVELELDGIGTNIKMDAAGKDTFAANWEARYSPYKETAFYLKATIFDKAGNRYELKGSTPYTIKDTIAPECQITSVDNPRSNNNDPEYVLIGGNTISITTSSNESLSGSDIKSFTWYKSYSPGYTSPYPFNCDAGLTGTNPKTCHLKADGANGEKIKFEAGIEDQAGNISRQHCLWPTEYTINQAAPEVIEYEKAASIKENAVLSFRFSESVGPESWKPEWGEAGEGSFAWDGDMKGFRLMPPNGGWNGAKQITIDLKNITDIYQTHLLNPGPYEYKIENIAPELLTTSVPAGSTAIVAFSEPVWADAGWATLDQNCVNLGIVVQANPVDAASPTDKLQLTFIYFQNKLIPSCTITINKDLIHDHDDPGTHLPENKTLPYDIQASMTGWAQTAWDQITVSFSEDVESQDGWAEFSSECTGTVIQANESEGKTLTITLDDRNPPSSNMICTLGILTDIINEKDYGAPITNATPITWQYDVRARITNWNVLVTLIPVIVEFSRPVTASTGWASLDPACTSENVQIQAPRYNTASQTLEIDVTIPPGAMVGKCEVTVLFDHIRDDHNRRPVGTNIIFFNVPAHYAGGTITGTATDTIFMAEFSEEITADAGWATLDSTCAALGMSLDAQMSDGLQNPLSAAINNALAPSGTACTITLDPAKLHDGDVDSISVSGLQPYNYTVP